MRVLKLSEAKSLNCFGDSGSLDESSCSKNLVSVDTQEGDRGAGNQNLHHELSFSDNCTSLSNDSGSKMCFETLTGEESPKIDGISQDHSSYVKAAEMTLSNDEVEKCNVETTAVKEKSVDELLQLEGAVPISLAKDTASINGNYAEISLGVEKIEIQSISATDAHVIPDNVNGFVSTGVSSLSLQNAGSDTSSDRIHLADVSEAFTSSLDGSEPIYEGEECILDSVTTTYEDREPIYEGEVILAKQADKSAVEGCDVKSQDEITTKQG